jgi:hypothetical protein
VNLSRQFYSSPMQKLQRCVAGPCQTEGSWELLMRGVQQTKEAAVVTCDIVHGCVTLLFFLAVFCEVMHDETVTLLFW